MWSRVATTLCTRGGHVCVFLWVVNAAAKKWARWACVSTKCMGTKRQTAWKKSDGQWSRVVVSKFCLYSFHCYVSTSPQFGSKPMFRSSLGQRKNRLNRGWGPCSMRQPCLWCDRGIPIFFGIKVTDTLGVCRFKEDDLAVRKHLKAGNQTTHPNVCALAWDTSQFHGQHLEVFVGGLPDRAEEREAFQQQNESEWYKITITHVCHVVCKQFAHFSSFQVERHFGKRTTQCQICQCNLFLSIVNCFRCKVWAHRSLQCVPSQSVGLKKIMCG